MTKTKTRTRLITMVGMLSAMAFGLMLLDFPLPIFPFFLKMDISDIPATIGTLLFGPVAGIFIELIKNILHLLKTSTAGVGEIANFIIGCAFIVPMWFTYAKNKTNKSLILGLLLGTVSMVIVSSLMNYFVMIPLFLKLFHIPLEEIVKASAKFNGNVSDFKTLIMYTIIPFNLLKCAVMSVATLLTYNSLKAHFVK